jgi:hypothetical protein
MRTIIKQEQQAIIKLGRNIHQARTLHASKAYFRAHTLAYA